MLLFMLLNKLIDWLNKTDINKDVINKSLQDGAVSQIMLFG